MYIIIQHQGRIREECGDKSFIYRIIVVSNGANTVGKTFGWEFRKNEIIREENAFRIKLVNAVHVEKI